MFWARSKKIENGKSSMAFTFGSFYLYVCACLHNHGFWVVFTLTFFLAAIFNIQRLVWIWTDCIQGFERFALRANAWSGSCSRFSLSSFCSTYIFELNGTKTHTYTEKSEEKVGNIVEMYLIFCVRFHLFSAFYSTNNCFLPVKWNSKQFRGTDFHHFFPMHFVEVLFSKRRIKKHNRKD